MSHQHGPGFTLDDSTLLVHLKLDHDVSGSVEDPTAAHAALHAHDGAEDGGTNLEFLASQFMELQNVVDQLILNDLLDL